MSLLPLVHKPSWHRLPKDCFWCLFCFPPSLAEDMLLDIGVHFARQSLGRCGVFYLPHSPWPPHRVTMEDADDPYDWAAPAIGRTPGGEGPILTSPSELGARAGALLTLPSLGCCWNMPKGLLIGPGHLRFTLVLALPGLSRGDFATLKNHAYIWLMQEIIGPCFCRSDKPVQSNNPISHLS